MLRLIEKIYKETKNKIAKENEEGENTFFWTGKRVKQGCTLSPKRMENNEHRGNSGKYYA